MLAQAQAQMAAHAQAQNAAQQQAIGQQQGAPGQDGNQSEPPSGFTYRNRARRKASEKPNVSSQPFFLLQSQGALLCHWLLDCLLMSHSSSLMGEPGFQMCSPQIGMDPHAAGWRLQFCVFHIHMHPIGRL